MWRTFRVGSSDSSGGRVSAWSSGPGSISVPLGIAANTTTSAYSAANAWDGERGALTLTTLNPKTPVGLLWVYANKSQMEEC